ncbi:MAG: BsuPI-related putative proteinase inhibitor [bacterium]
MREIILTIWIILISFTLALCSTDGISTPIDSGKSCASVLKDGLLLQLVSNEARYSYRDEVKLRFKVVNVSGTVMKLFFPTGIRYTFEVYKDDVKVWGCENGGFYLPGFSVYNMASGETLSCEAVWNQMVGSRQNCEPGDYVAKAYIMTSPLIATLTVDFTIEE